MSALNVKKRVKEAFDHLRSGNVEGALLPALVAVDASAAAQATHKQKGNRKRYIEYLEKHINPLLFPGLVMRFEGLGSKENANAGSFCELLYEYLRCSMLHEGKIDDRISFDATTTDSLTLGNVGGRFVISGYIVKVILLGILQDPANKQALDELVAEGYVRYRE